MKKDRDRSHLPYILYFTKRVVIVSVRIIDVTGDLPELHKLLLRNTIAISRLFIP